MGQSRTDNPDKTNNIGHTRHETRTHKTKKHNILCVGHPNTNTQTNTNNVNKTRSSQQRTRGKDEPNIVLMRKS
jgi:hypothetical protein